MCLRGRQRLGGGPSPVVGPVAPCGFRAQPLAGLRAPLCAPGPARCLRTAGMTLAPCPFQTQPSEKPVQDRGLVVTDPRAEDVVLEHRSYCSAKARERHFAGDVLGYVTPVSGAPVARAVSGQGSDRGLPFRWGCRGAR